MPATGTVRVRIDTSYSQPSVASGRAATLSSLTVGCGYVEPTERTLKV